MFLSMNLKDSLVLNVVLPSWWHLCELGIKGRLVWRREGETREILMLGIGEEG